MAVNEKSLAVTTEHGGIKQLLDSMEECDRLQKSMKEMERNHARVEEGYIGEMKALTNIHAVEVTSLEQAKNDLIDQKLELMEIIDGLETDVESARDKISILSSELTCAKEMATLEKKQLNAKISSLEAELKSKEESERRNITGSKRKR